MNAQRRWSTVNKRVVVLLIAALGIVLVARVGEIVRPFVWALVLAYVLLPLVAVLERRLRVGRGLAAALVFAALLAIIIGIGRLLVPLALSQIGDLQRALPTLLRNAEDQVAQWLVAIGLGDLGGDVVFGQGTQEVAQGAARLLFPVAAAIGRFLLELLVFLIAVFFLLRDAPTLFAWLREQIPLEQRGEFLPLAAQVSTLIGRYIRGQLVLVVVMSTVTTLGLSLLGLPYSLLLGVVTGVLELIPIAGPITAGAIASVVALGHPSPFGWSQLVYVGAVIAMYTVLRHAEDYFVIPLVIGRIVRLHPAVVIFSLLAGGALFGLLGVLLAVPTAATLRLVLIYVKAKVRDEDPFPQIAREIVEEPRPEGSREARAVPRQARP